MTNLENCAFCGKSHQPIETNLCQKCSDKLTTAFKKILSNEDAESLAFVIGNIDLGSRWNTTEIVKHQNRLDELSINFKKHDHKNGKVVTYL